jgi:phosphatidylglycerophosphate synthase
MDISRSSLLSSIALTLGCYWAAETAGVAMVGGYAGIPKESLAQFLAAQTAFHAGLYVFLFFCRTFFYIEATARQLDRVNIANKITLFRVSMLPSILFLILSAKAYDVAPILMVVLAVTFITDIVDGRLSRARNEVTRIGRILDSVSDYSLLIVIAVAYRAYGLLPLWLFLIILFRLLFQACGMLAILMIRGKVEPQPTLMGKIAIATTMSLFAAEALKLVLPEERLGLLAYAEAAAGFVVAISVLDKGYFFFKQRS